MGRRHDFSAREEYMHIRCINWGMAMRGGMPNDAEIEEHGSSVDELDALALEPLMCQLRRWRKQQYNVVKYLYLRGRSTIEASNYFRHSEWWVRKRQREALGMLLRFYEEGIGLKSTA